MCLSSSAEPPAPGVHAVGPLSPREELATFQIAKGFRIELVASEPDIIDPVAMAFDENGRLFVAEMHGYPNEGVGTGTITSGKIKLLEDRNGDGIYESSKVYADNLRLPMSVMPCKGGLLVGVAPDILYLEDTNGDGKADRQRVLYTGFDLSNIQQMVNGLQWGLDNWVYGIAGSKGGNIKSVEKPDAKEVALRGRGFRFHPDVPGSLEPTSGGGQYGLAADDYQLWFTSTNSQHIRHIVLPDHYLRRNPYLAVSAVTLDIADHGAACKVHRVSPFEAWRVERTTRRKDGPDAARFSPTELVPGGFSTSTCGSVVYCADQFPKEYRGNVFVCDPANNLIHRDILEEKGATFVAKRGDVDCEFLASTDNWFRPVQLTLGPDGALYLLDFYREAIETPLSLPDDIKAKLNLQSRGRGRIWRITWGDKVPHVKPAPGKASAAELVKLLDSPNQWQRLTAQRLLIERQDKSVVKALEQLAREAKTGPGRAHALWTLDGLKALDDELVTAALKDPEPGVREQALRIGGERRVAPSKYGNALEGLVNDPSPRVRFQLALSAWNLPMWEYRLHEILRRDVADPWVQAAALSCCNEYSRRLLHLLVKDEKFRNDPAGAQFLGRLAAIMGARGRNEEDISHVLLAASQGNDVQAWQTALLAGLGQGMQQSSTSLAQLWKKPPAEVQEDLEKLRPTFARAVAISRDRARSAEERLASIRLLGYGPFTTAGPALGGLLTPQTSGDLQMAAVRALALHEEPQVGEAMLAGWAAYSPAVRREATEALFARKDRLGQLLTAIEKKQVLPAQLEPARLDQLRKHADPKIKQRAQTLLAGQVAPDRKKVLDDYKAALELKGEPASGKAVFKKNCATCHRLENEGIEVGADLNAALRNKTADALLLDILDPSREVDPRYLNYFVSLKSGKSLSGLIAAETGTSLTLRRAEKAEDVILRDQIEDGGIIASGKSLMPEGLEAQLSKQDLADVMAYLLSVAGRK